MLKLKKHQKRIILLLLNHLNVNITSWIIEVHMNLIISYTKLKLVKGIWRILLDLILMKLTITLKIDI